MNLNQPRHQIFSGVAAVVLLGVFARYFGEGFIGYNAGQFVEWVVSPAFLAFAVLAAVLLQKKVPDRWFNVAIGLFSFGYFYAGYHGYIDLFTMEGDNICQVAYWNILFRPHLAGSVGASFTKPGHLLLLGSLHDLAGIAGPAVFKAGWCLAMAACAWVVARVATDIGGRVAGLVALPVVFSSFLFEFLSGSATIVVVPLLYAGLRLLLVRKEHRPWGRLLLVLSLHFHIYAVAVLGVVWLILLARKERREAWLLALWTGLSLLIWVGVIYRIQGALARLDSGGAAGYVGPVDGVPANKFAYIAEVFRAEVAGDPGVLLLLGLGLVGVAGALCYGARAYLAVLAIFVVLIANVFLLSGTLNIHRFFAAYYALGCTVGIGALLACLVGAIQRRHLASLALAILAVVALFASVDYAMLNHYRQIQSADVGSIFASNYLQGADHLMNDSLLPRSTRLMTEDDFLYPIIVREPDRYPALSSLQAFNVASAAGRKAFLAKTDYLWIALAGRHSYYYLFHLPDQAWNDDPFRRMVLAMLEDGVPRDMYGYRFVPVDADVERLVIRVEPLAISGPDGKG